MPIRIDDREIEDEGGDSPRKSDATSRGLLKGVIALGGVIVFFLVVILLLLLNRGEVAAPGDPDPSSSTSASAEPGGDETEPAGEPTSLPRSEVGIGGDRAHGTLGPLFINYDQTQEGAIAAALNYTVALGEPDKFNDQTRHLVDEYVYATDEARKKFSVSDETAAEAREEHGIDQNGESTDPDKKVYTGNYPEYGAFQVMGTKGNTEVTVNIWYPNVFGVGNKAEDVTVMWTYWQHRMVWVDDDWRIAEHQETPTPVPAPAEPEVVNVSFAERAELLGKGWEMPANASEDIIDRIEFPEE